MATYIQDYLYAELPKDLAAYDVPEFPTEPGIYKMTIDSEGNYTFKRFVGDEIVLVMDKNNG